MSALFFERSASGEVQVDGEGGEMGYQLNMVANVT